MKNKQILELTANFVRKSLEDAESGHDWNHVERVMNNANIILKNEKADDLVVLMGVLLHDIADPKFHDGNEEKGINISKIFLHKTGLDDLKIEGILEIVKHISFKGGMELYKNPSMELKIAQDADRLDAIGAIGIARTFHYGGYKNRKIYVPDEKPKKYASSAEYWNSDASTINHFYEKLLLLKDGMHTKTGKKIAKKRHRFMKKYLKQFYKEIDGKN